MSHGGEAKGLVFIVIDCFGNAIYIKKMFLFPIMLLSLPVLTLFPKILQELIESCFWY